MPAAGTPVSHFEDSEIEAVIEHYDDPSHPDALDVETTREHLGRIQQTLAESWTDRMDAVRSGALTVATDLDALLVLRDPERRAWNRLLDGMELYDSVARTILRVVHHQAATRLSERSFDGSDPIVVKKPDCAVAGQLLVESVLARLTNRGLTATEAWAYYGIELTGTAPDRWLGYGPFEDRVALADAVERAQDKLGS